MQGVTQSVVDSLSNLTQGIYNALKSFESIASTVGNVLLFSCFLAAVLFVLIYGHYADWRGSRFGNHLIKFMQVAVFSLGLAVIRVFWHEFPLFQYLRVTVLLGLNWVLWWRVWIVLEQQGVVKTAKSQRHFDENRADSRVALQLLDDQEQERQDKRDDDSISRVDS